MQLNQSAMTLIHAYSKQLAKNYGTTDASKQYSVTGPMETKLRKTLLDSCEFLGMINCIDVDQLKGQIVGVGHTKIHTGRKKGGRFINQVTVDGNTYELAETDSCAQLEWFLLCTWANAGSEEEFFKLVNEHSNEAFALDMLRVGFNGTSIAPDTDPEANPNGEDVNIGWHKIATNYKEGLQVVTSAVTLGENGDYKTLDAMASDLINAKIPSQLRNDPRLVVLVGADLVAAESQRLYNNATTPTEKIAAQQLSTSLAGRTTYIPPFMPGKRMVVTYLKNLTIATQKGTRKRKAEDVEDRKAFENKYWRMEGYALDDPDGYAAFDESAITIEGEVDVIKEKEAAANGGEG